MEPDLNLLVDALPGLIWIADAAGSVAFLNRRWSDYTGVASQQACGDGWQTAIHPHDLPIVIERWRHIIKTSEPADVEARIRSAGGEYRWFLLRGNPLRDADGRIVHWCGVATDIEQRKQTEDAVRDEDLNFLVMVDSIPGLVAVTRPDGVPEHANPQFLGYFGMTLDELKGWATSGAIHPDHLPREIESWSAALATGCMHEVESRYRRADGVYRWCHTRGFPLRDAEGRIVHWFVLITDIDDRKRAEETSRDLDLSLRQIVDSIPGFVAVMTGDGQREHVNAPLLEFFGKTLEELNDWETGDVVHPDDVSHVVEVWMDALATGGAYELESRYRRADGVYRWCRTRGFPLRNAEGRIVRWFILITDIDDRKRAEMLLAGEKRLLEMVARGQSLTGTLEELCRVVETTFSGCRCSVFVVGAGGTRLEQGVSPSMPRTFLDSILRSPIAAASNPSAMACSGNKQVVVADAATETRWASDWSPMALAHGVRACWATPFSSREGRVLGAFTLYYDEPRTPTTSFQRLIEQLTHIAAIAVERAQSDAALITSEARKAAILDSALDCIVTIDHEGRIAEFNPAAENAFGYRRDEVIGRAMADVLVPSDLQEQFRNAFIRYLASADPQLLGRRVERMARRADGSEFPIEVAVTRIATDGPPMFTGFLRDITERKRAIEERDWAETRLAGEKLLLEMIASGQPLQDVLDALCKFVEHAATDCICAVHLIDSSSGIFHDGASPSLGRGYIEALDRLPVRLEIGPCADAAFTKSQVIAEDLHTESRWKGTPFETLSVQLGLRSVWSTPIYALAGEVLGTFAMYQREPGIPSPRERELIAQVTHIASVAIEKAQAESALKRSEALLGEGERLSLTGTFWWRVETGEITWSEQVYRIFEFDRSIPVTLDLIATRLHPEDVPAFQQVIEHARTDRSDFEYETRLQMPGGAVKHVHVVAHYARDHNALEYIGAVHDVTERRRSEEALGKVRSELAHVARVSSLGTLTASIAHEVNQPLSGIVTNASTCLRMLDADPANVEGARETARRTIRDAHRASEVVTRLRALFSKNGGAFEPVDLNEATREVIALSRSELQRKRVILFSELADDLPPVTGDRVQLQQVILNMLLNASDAMSSVEDRPRQVVIRTERDDGNGVCVTVRDAGNGFEPHLVEKVFEPFYTTKSDGMGIGLAVSRSIIESHHGRIWAKPNDGPGATFAFSIPDSRRAT